MDKADLKQKNGQAVSRELNNNLQIFLKEYDNIRFERVNTSGGTEGRQIKFSYYPLEDETAQEHEEVIQKDETTEEHEEVIQKDEQQETQKTVSKNDEDNSKAKTDNHLF